MPLAGELRRQIHAAARDERGLEELRLWLAEWVQAIADLRNPEVQDLADQAWIVLAEWIDGHRDEAGARRALASLVGAPARAKRADEPAPRSRRP